MTTEAQLSLPLLTLESASPEARAMLEKANAQIGFVPNMYAGMAQAPGALATYQDGYARFRQGSGFNPVEQEVVFLVISVANGCDYCTAAHSMIADKVDKMPAAVLRALRANEPLPDPKLAALARFTRHLFETRGRPSAAQLADFVAAGYTERQVLEIVLALAVKTISNYTNHLFHTAVDRAFHAYMVEPA